MSDLRTLSTKLLGKSLLAIGYTPLGQVGFKRICLSLLDDHSVTLASQERRLDRYECYDLVVADEDIICEDNVNITAAPRIVKVSVFVREEWLDPVPDAQRLRLIGHQPVSQNYGPVGSAPNGSMSTVCDAALLLEFEGESQRALIYQADYPGLLLYTAVDQEIEEFLAFCTRSEGQGASGQ